jgi:hypothetical protein
LKNYFCQLLNAYGINDVWQTEIHTAEPLIVETSSADIKIATEKLKRCKSPCVYQIQVELIEAGGNTLHSAIRKLIKSV